MTFNEWLRHQMASQRVNTRTLALRAGVSPSTVSRILNREREPLHGTVVKLRHALGFDRVGRDVDPLDKRLERLLRSDPLMTEPSVRTLMDAWWRLRRPNGHERPRSGAGDRRSGATVTRMRP